MLTDAVERVAALFAARGDEAYLGEAVSMAAHMLQAAALAEAEGSEASLVAAALLHDIGHLADEGGDHHEAVGAALLGDFPPVVADCARLHVPAKRYLCATEADYARRLSPESRRTLALQGGAMRPDEVAAFVAEPFHAEAMRVRRWDDAAKVPAMPTRSFDSYRPLLASVAGAKSRPT